MKIRDFEIDLDVLELLQEYEWKKGTRKGNEWFCCSPFRDENNPSFSVNLETGLWIDFGATDVYWKKGNLISLIAFLDNVTYEEVEESLLVLHGITLNDSDGLELNINFQFSPAEPKTFSKDDLSQYMFRNREYLARRGISDEIMKKFIVCYDREKEAIAFLWQDARTGKVINVKFRSIRGKQFYYIKDGQPIRNHIYGLYHARQQKAKTIIVVESEIDALFLWSLGYYAVALGGSHFTEEQKQLLLLSGVEHLIIATDNDQAGNRIRWQLAKELSGHMIVEHFYIPYPFNDINDLDAMAIHIGMTKVAEHELRIIKSVTS